MYATCTFCHRALGSNESIEVFPVGRRLAFDATKGRLWVVCTHCAQWNLTPLEERWEAIEGAERLFRDSRLRHSTDNIGLARLRDGTELIRIGNPVRPEMAAWRYGANLVRRWKGAATGMGVGAVVGVGAAMLLPASIPLLALTVAAANGAAIGAVGAHLIRLGGKIAFVGQFIVDNEHQYVRVSPKEMAFVRLIAHENGWALRVPYHSRRPTVEHHWQDVIDLGGTGHVTISGQAALTATRQLLPIINGWGARKTVVEDAVKLASSWESTESGFAYSLARARELASQQLFGDPGSLYHLPAPMRLALEMSLHEDEEQRALNGELAELQRMWRDAEEIAGISDALMVPGRVQRTLDQLRGRNRLA